MSYIPRFFLLGIVFSLFVIKLTIVHAAENYEPTSSSAKATASSHASFSSSSEAETAATYSEEIEEMMEKLNKNLPQLGFNFIAIKPQDEAQ